MQHNSTHLVQLVSQVYRIDVVAFEIGKHDDLGVKKSIKIKPPPSVSARGSSCDSMTLDDSQRRQ